MSAGAWISEDGTYRYDLRRSWTQLLDTTGTVCWVMLNPSTADAHTDDATIRRCIAFSKRSGFSGLVVVNLFAYRATDPKRLRLVTDPVGPDNDRVAGFWIRHLPCIAAWGSWGAKHYVQPRVEWFLEQARFSPKPVQCLGITQEQQPRHPLYVAAQTDLEPLNVERLRAAS